MRQKRTEVESGDGSACPPTVCYIQARLLLPSYSQLTPALLTTHWITEMLDYNQEAEKLFESFDGSKPNSFNNLDPIYRSQAGGFIYVGGDLVRMLSFTNKPIEM